MSLATASRSWRRRLRQDLRVLRGLFPWHVAAVLVAGALLTAWGFQRAYRAAGGPGAADFSYVKALYAVFNMAAFQVSFADMPPGPQLDLFFVLVPLVSIPLLLLFGANLVHVVRVFFVRRERGQVWQRALAATVPHPIVVCGLGRVGYRVAGQLLDLGKPVIGIDTTPSPLVQSLIDADMPVIMGDIRDRDVLRAAGVERAAAVVVCTYDDLANLEATFHIRELNGAARVVMRLFDDELTDEIRAHFQVQVVLSRSALAAEAFAYAALGLDVLESFPIDEHVYVLARVPIVPASPWVGETLATVAKSRRLTVVCLHKDGKLLVEPPPETPLGGGDTLFVFTEPSRLSSLVVLHGDHGTEPALARPVLVCGLGHTGYRVVTALASLGKPVIAMDMAPGALSERLEESGIPVLYGDFRQQGVLENAGIASAAALIVCAEEDMVNFAAGIRARALVPGLRIVMRIFEEPLGLKVQRAFDIDAVYSTSALAAPAFVAAALDVHLTQAITLDEDVYSMVRLTVEGGSPLERQTIRALDQERELTVLLSRRGDAIAIPPAAAEPLAPGDEVVVLVSQDKLRSLGLSSRI